MIVWEFFKQFSPQKKSKQSEYKINKMCSFVSIILLRKILKIYLTTIGLVID